MAEPTALCSKQEGTGNGFINGRIIIQKHRSMLQRELNVSVLLPYLNKYHMLTTNLHDELTLPTTINAAKVDRFVAELPKGRGDYLECLIKCLRESVKEEPATSHDKIANVLEEELEHQNTSGFVFSNCSSTTETAGSANSLVCGRVLQKFHTELRRDLNIPVLLPYLIKYHLITANSREELSLPTTTHTAKVDRLVAELPKKGENSLERFIKCLRDSMSEAPTHGNIADIFEEELNLRSAPGFTDSCDDHTRETGDEETEMAVLAVLSEGTAVDKSLLVEGGNHHHRKQTSLKLKKICCNRWCWCYTVILLIIALLALALIILSQVPHITPLVTPKALFTNSTVELQFDQMDWLDRLDMRLHSSVDCQPQGKLYVIRGHDCNELSNITTSYVDPYNPVDRVYMRPGSTINFTVSPNSYGQVWIFTNCMFSSDPECDASRFDCQQPPQGSFCFEAAQYSNRSYLHPITQSAYYFIRQHPPSFNVTPNKNNFGHSYHRVLHDLGRIVSLAENVTQLSSTYSPIYIGNPFSYDEICVLLNIAEGTVCGNDIQLQSTNVTRRQDVLLYPAIVFLIAVVILVVVIGVHVHRNCCSGM